MGLARDATQAGQGAPRERNAGRTADVLARRLGLAVDELIGQQDIVIKALGRSLREVRGFSGATELGDHKVALVLDIASIIEETLSGGDARELRGATYA